MNHTTAFNWLYEYSKKNAHTLNISSNFCSLCIRNYPCLYLVLKDFFRFQSTLLHQFITIHRLQPFQKFILWTNVRSFYKIRCHITVCISKQKFDMYKTMPLFLLSFIRVLAFFWICHWQGFECYTSNSILPPLSSVAFTTQHTDF